MDAVEYLELTPAESPDRNFRARVVFNHSGTVSGRTIDVLDLSQIIARQPAHMMFDDHPHVVKRIDFDLIKRTVTIHAEALPAVQGA